MYFVSKQERRRWRRQALCVLAGFVCVISLLDRLNMNNLVR
jgi:hypothetical protein